MPSKATWQKVQILKIHDGGRLPFWKSLNRHISVKNRPILMKFGRLHCSKYWTRRLSHEKLKEKKIQDGVVRHLEYRFYGHNLSKYLTIPRFLLCSSSSSTSAGVQNGSRRRLYVACRSGPVTPIDRRRQRRPRTRRRCWGSPPTMSCRQPCRHSF